MRFAGCPATFKKRDCATVRFRRGRAERCNNLCIFSFLNEAGRAIRSTLNQSSKPGEVAQHQLQSQKGVYWGRGVIIFCGYRLEDSTSGHGASRMSSLNYVAHALIANQILGGCGLWRALCCCLFSCYSRMHVHVCHTYAQHTYSRAREFPAQKCRTIKKLFARD